MIRKLTRWAFDVVQVARDEWAACQTAIEVAELERLGPVEAEIRRTEAELHARGVRNGIAREAAEGFWKAGSDRKMPKKATGPGGEEIL